MKLNPFLEKAIEAAAEKHGIDPRIIKAVGFVESAWNTLAVRFEPDYPYTVSPITFAKKNGLSIATEVQLQKMSWGPLQIMGGNVRSLGFDGNLLTMATSPSLALDYGVQYLKSRYQLYGASAKGGWSEPVIAAYNAGSPAKGGDGKWKNEGYVRKVEKAYLAL